MDIFTGVVRLLSSHTIYFVKLTHIIYKHKFIMDSMDCPMFLAPSVFSDVYLHKRNLLAYEARVISLTAVKRRYLI